MVSREVIPIKQVRLSTENIVQLVTVLSNYYRNRPNAERYAYYKLSVAIDEHTSTILDVPPEENQLKALFARRISKLSLTIYMHEPECDIQLQLTHGETHEFYNQIELRASEDWVTLASKALCSQIMLFARQPSLKNRIYSMVPVVAFIAFGWFILSLLFRVLSYIPSFKTIIADPASSSADLVAKIILVFVVMLAVWLTERSLSYVKSAFPSVELQTGPQQDRLESNRRKTLKWFIGLFILGPCTNLIYDIYRTIIS